KPLLRDAMWTFEIVDLNVGGHSLRGGPIGQRTLHHPVDVDLRQLLGGPRRTRRRHWITNCGKNTRSTAPFGKIGMTASRTCFLIPSRRFGSVSSSTFFLPSSARMRSRTSAS